MALVRRLIASSIGRKWVMALTGLGLVSFLSIHLLGNLTIYGGGALFVAYAHRLHAVGPVLKAVETALLGVAAAHVTFALILIVENLRARSTRYRAKRSEGGRSWGSRTMLYSGPYILIFVVLHLWHFTFAGGTAPISTVVTERFGHPEWMAFYVFSMVVVGLHVSHGLWSAFQTLGVETLRRGGLRRLTLVVSLGLAIGFASLPVVVFSIAGLLN